MATKDTARFTALLSGRVQGVGFRAFARRTALDMGLAGYAENLGDGRVEVVAEGPRDDLEHYLDRLRQGPAHAEVTGVDVNWTEGSGLHGFNAY